MFMAFVICILYRIWHSFLTFIYYKDVQFGWLRGGWLWCPCSSDSDRLYVWLWLFICVWIRIDLVPRGSTTCGLFKFCLRLLPIVYRMWAKEYIVFFFISFSMMWSDSHMRNHWFKVNVLVVYEYNIIYYILSYVLSPGMYGYEVGASQRRWWLVCLRYPPIRFQHDLDTIW